MYACVCSSFRRFDVCVPCLQPRTITPEEAYQHFCFLYVSYIQVFRKLEDCYDQCVHPQKRQDIKLSLEAVRDAFQLCDIEMRCHTVSHRSCSPFFVPSQAMARMCQLKHEIVRFNPRIRTDYISVEELLIDLKLTPAQLEVPIPHYFREGAYAIRNISRHLVALSLPCSHWTLRLH
jgi:hypothetical protein